MSQYVWLKYITILWVVILGTTVTFADETSHFRIYKYPSDGFEAAFPQKPLQFRTDMGEKLGYSNSYQTLVVNPFSQYSVFVNHSPRRVFEDAAIDAYLTSSIRGRMIGLNDAVLRYTKRTKLLGFPAMEYQYSHKLEGVPAENRGVVFIVDGEHIKLSYIFLPDDIDADNNFKTFVSSFQLVPFEHNLAKHQFNDRGRNISFLPPEGWRQGNKSEFPQVVVIYDDPAGHSITVLDSGTPTYTCDNYKLEMKTMGSIQNDGVISVQDRTVSWLKSTADNVDAGIRMTSIHYCLDTTVGAVVMIGAAPEQTFFRSERIFRKVASSLVARK